MAKAKKRADGRYCKSFTYNGKKYFAYGTSQGDAEKAAYEKKLALEAGKQDHDDPRLNVFFEKWSDNRTDSVKEATLLIGKRHFDTMKNISVCGGATTFGNMRLSEITPDDIRAIQQNLLERGNSTRTINDKISVLSHMFSDAIKERYIDYNPCVAVKTLKRTEETARNTIHRAFTLEEQATFFEAAENSFYYDVYRMALLTGMRIGEIGGLYLSDIYDDKIHIERTVTKSAAGAYIIGNSAKTEKGRRTIPLNDAIREVITHQKEINKMLDDYKVVGIRETIFKAPERGILIGHKVDEDISRICKRCNLEKFTMHALRATFATRAIESGVEPKVLQELLGHTSFKMTMDLYAHVMDDTKSEAMEKIKIVI